MQVFLEQKKMLKTGLTVAHFKRYIPLIEQETCKYFERWGDSGKRGKAAVACNCVILVFVCEVNLSCWLQICL